MSDVRLRALTRADFPLLAEWLQEPLVARWWDHQTSSEAVDRDFGPSVDGSDPALFFVASHQGIEYGLVQYYPINAYPEYVTEFKGVYELPRNAYSTDYLVGVSGMRGRGLGAAMVQSAVDHAWASEVAAGPFVIAVNASNTTSWRTLERAGFTRVASGDMEPDNPIDATLHYIYRHNRQGPS